MKFTRAATWMAVAVVGASVLVGSAPAHASTRSDGWRARAVAAIDAFRATDGGAERVGAYAYMMEAVGRVYGWDDPRVAEYLAKVWSMQNPDGGWGLPYAYDAFKDGTVNPADTSYAVTMADHVGLPFVAAYRAGLVTADQLKALMWKIMALPRVPVEKGQCVAYSTQTWDAKTGYCVHNANAGVGYFLQEVNAAGLGTTGLHKLVTDISVHTVTAYRTADVWWPYNGDGALQDTDHEGYTAQSVYALSYWVGREAAYKVMNTEYPSTDLLAPLAHMRLVSTPGGVGSMDPAGSGTTLWCVMGDRWTSEADAFLANPPGATEQNFRRAQVAVFSARNAAACA